VDYDNVYYDDVELSLPAVNDSVRIAFLLGTRCPHSPLRALRADASMLELIWQWVGRRAVPEWQLVQYQPWRGPAQCYLTLRQSCIDDAFYGHLSEQTRADGQELAQELCTSNPFMLRAAVNVC
jgi:hypothetical protein